MVKVTKKRHEAVPLVESSGKCSKNQRSIQEANRNSVEAEIQSYLKLATGNEGDTIIVDEGLSLKIDSKTLSKLNVNLAMLGGSNIMLWGCFSLCGTGETDQSSWKNG